MGDNSSSIQFTSSGGGWQRVNTPGIDIKQWASICFSRDLKAFHAYAIDGRTCGAMSPPTARNILQGKGDEKKIEIKEKVKGKAETKPARKRTSRKKKKAD